MRIVYSSLAVFLGVLIACGSSDSSDDNSSSGGGSGGLPEAGASSSSSGSSGGMDAKVPPVPKDFPLVTPSTHGYKLTKVWGDDVIFVPAAIVWPKVAGAAPFALERMGQIVRLANNTRTEVLDFSSDVHMAGEGGAVGMTLHPQFGDGTGAKPYVYVWFNANGPVQKLARWTWDPVKQNFDPLSELVLVNEAETTDEHNGGRIAFGPDGFLYFGDGNDLNSASNDQTITRALFSGVFRIDVDMQGGAVSHTPPRQPEGGSTQGYYIPNDNPFVGVANANEEFFALGFRNPFSFSFDRGTGQLWLGDVGETFREEIDLVEKGGNYQWPYKEGELVQGSTAPTLGTSKDPKYTYWHSSMADLSAVFGGFVYRGKSLPELVGKYIYTDYVSARVWALDISGANVTRKTLVDNYFGKEPLAISEDEDGEIYVCTLGGIWKLERDTTIDLVPKTITETKVYKDIASETLADGFVPYEINSPLWSDGAVKRRFVRVPAGQKATVDADGNFVFPVGTLFVKEFDVPANVTVQNRSRHLETRVLVVGNETTYGLSYKWNAAGDDGDLVIEPTDEDIHDTAANQNRPYHYPNFGQCWSCHRQKNRILGFTTRQVVKPDVLAAAGVFDASIITTFPQPLAKPTDTTADLEARATAYLAANCSSCHRPGNSFLGDGDTWNALPGVATADRGLVNMPHHNEPMASGLGIPNAPLIDPGNANNSILMGRLKATDERYRMPPLERNFADPDGVAVVEQWINSLTP